jgi:hypothetical protein
MQTSCATAVLHKRISEPFWFYATDCANCQSAPYTVNQLHNTQCCATWLIVNGPLNPYTPYNPYLSQWTRPNPLRILWPGLERRTVHSHDICARTCGRKAVDTDRTGSTPVRCEWFRSAAITGTFWFLNSVYENCYCFNEGPAPPVGPYYGLGTHYGDAT